MRNTIFKGIKWGSVISLLISCYFHINAEISDANKITQDKKNAMQSDFTQAKIIGGKGWDQGINIIQQKDHYVFLANSIKSFTKTTDILIGELNQNFELTQLIALGGTHQDLASDFIQTDDHGLFIVANSQSMFNTPLRIFNTNKPHRGIAIKLDEHYNLEWSIDLFSGIYDGAVNIADGGFLLSGKQKIDNGHNPIIYQALLTKITSTGDFSWSKTIELEGGKYIGANRIQKNDQGNMVLVQVTTNSNHYQYGFGIIDIDDEGIVQKDHYYFPKNDRYIFMRSISEIQDHKILLCGEIAKNIDSNKSDLTITTLDRNRHINWIKKISTPDYSIIGVDSTYYQNYILVVGYMKQLNNNDAGDIVYFLINENGDLEKYFILGDPTFNAPNQIISNNDATITIGSTEINHENQNLFVYPLHNLDNFIDNADTQFFSIENIETVSADIQIKIKNEDKKTLSMKKLNIKKI